MTIKTLYLDDPPAGSNKLGSRAGFVQRLSYEKYFTNFLKAYGLEENDFFDARNKDINYGRVDYYGNTIHVSETFLKNIPGSEEYRAINFVSDAFEHFKYLMETTTNTSYLISDTFKEIKPKNGLKNIHKKYHEHMNNLYKAYLEHSTIMMRNKKIIDFSSFLNNFISFLDVIANKTPFLKSSFIESRELSVIDSGFVIEIESITKDKDEDKFKKYYDSADFFVYYGFAKKTGFKIDRDCPWRMVFDVNSQYAKQYMSQYEINGEDIFEDYFHKTLEYDLENLKLYLIMFYNSYAEAEPAILSPILTIKNDILLTTSEKKNRNQMTLEFVDNNIRPEYWFKLMCYIKLIENKTSLTQTQYENQIQKLLNVYNKQGLASGFGNLKKLIQNSEKSENKTFIFT